MDPRKKQVLIIAVCSTILVIMGVALIVMNMSENKHEDTQDVNASKKAIQTICENTDYKKTCIDSLNSAGTNSSDPRELIQVVFQQGMKLVNKAADNSTTLQKLERDPHAKLALETCNELVKYSSNDLNRSLAKFNGFDVTRVDDILPDLKTWISGAMTQQETCLDGFKDVPGNAGQKMREALKIAMEMSSNALAMVEELATFLESMGSFKRRLLSLDGYKKEPAWLDSNGKLRRFLLTAGTQKIKADVVIAKDGSGKYKTINEALEHIPKKRPEVFVIYIKQGVYKENVRVASTLKNLMLIGNGPTKTRITGNLNFIDGIPTYHTATVAVHGDGFIARNIGIENLAGPEKHQAVALRVSADKAVFYNCHMHGYQDTLYAHAYRQFYRDCVISGTIDFIFGDGAVVLQGCTMLIRKPMNNQQCIVTAQGRKDVRQPTALVLQNCTIKADADLELVKQEVKSYLGRPWKAYSRTIIMESFIDNLIQGEGWLPWNETFALSTLFYTEFNNRGPAAPKMARVKWPGVKELPPNRIKRFTAGELLDGDQWIPKTRVPYKRGFIFPVPKEDPNVKYSPVAPEENQDLGSQSKSSSDATTAVAPSPAEVASPSPASSPIDDPQAIIVVDPPASSPALSPDVESMAPSAETIENSDFGSSFESLFHDLAPANSPDSLPYSSEGDSPASAPGESDEADAPSPTPSSSLSSTMNPKSNKAYAPDPSSSESPGSAPTSSALSPDSYHDHVANAPTLSSDSSASTPDTSPGPNEASPSPTSLRGIPATKP